jgi:site-specific recombinase XerD
MSEKTKLHIQKVVCDGQIRIGIPIHPSDTSSREQVKTILGRIWHENERIWTIPRTPEAYDALLNLFGKENILINSTADILTVTPPQYPTRSLPLKEGWTKKEGKFVYRPLENNSLFDQLNPKQKLALSKLEELLIEERKTYSTRNGYRSILAHLFHYYPNTLPSQISEAALKAFILKEIKEKNISKSRQNHLVSAFKAFYERLLGQADKVSNLFRPEKEIHLPKDLTPEEVKRLFSQVGNLKHRCILMLMYGSGLRVGEVVRLSLKDLDFEQKTVFIQSGKHYRDRYSILSETAIVYIKRYLAEYQPPPKVWLFESPQGNYYSERSVQQFFAEAKAKAKIDKPVSTHSLRHSFATQLLKAHTDLDFVRKVMGHASIETTQIYLHVLKTDLTKTRSPLDDLDL